MVEDIYKVDALPGPLTIRYSISYDNGGRVIQVNDRHFFYGVNNKVTHSRIERIDTVSIGRYRKYIETLNFEWDLIGRIGRIVADSIYHHEYSKWDDVISTHSQSLSRGTTIISHEYNGNHRLPASITQRVGYESTGVIPIMNSTIWMEYKGDQVISSHTKIWYGEPAGTPATVIYNWYRYGNQLHYLYSVCQQMGFHPLALMGGTSSQFPVSAYQQMMDGSMAIEAKPDWNKAQNYQFQYNALKQLIEVRSSNHTIRITYR